MNLFFTILNFCSHIISICTITNYLFSKYQKFCKVWIGNLRYYNFGNNIYGLEFSVTNYLNEDITLTQYNFSIKEHNIEPLIPIENLTYSFGTEIEPEWEKTIKNSKYPYFIKNVRPLRKSTLHSGDTLFFRAIVCLDSDAQSMLKLKVSISTNKGIQTKSNHPFLLKLL